MSSKIVILAFLLYISGSILCINGANIHDQRSIAKSTSGGVILNLISSTIENAKDMFMNLIESILESTKSFIMDTFNMIFTSDDTRMTTTRSARSVNSSSKEYLSGGSSIMSMLSDAFIAPFKMTFGIVKNISFDSLFERAKDLVSPILANPAVEIFVNTSKDVVDLAASEFWNFTKINVLPEINDAVTTLRKSDTLPRSVDNYLGDLQNLYLICHTFGIM